MDFQPLGARFWMILEPPEAFFESRIAFRETCVKRYGLKNMLWWLGRQGADQGDLIICVAIWMLYKVRVPLNSDDFRASCIASRNRLRRTSLLGAILEALGAQYRRKNRYSRRFFFDVFFLLNFSPEKYIYTLFISHFPCLGSGCWGALSIRHQICHVYHILNGPEAIYYGM